MYEKRIKIPLKDINLDLNDETFQILRTVNKMLSTQSVKPLRLGTDGETGVIYSFISKHDVQDFIKLAKSFMQQKEQKETEEISDLATQSQKAAMKYGQTLPDASDHKEQEIKGSTEQPTDTIDLKETSIPIATEETDMQSALQKLKEIPEVSTEITTELPEEKTVTICCENCGHPNELTQKQFALIKHFGKFECENCHKMLTIETEETPQKLDKQKLSLTLTTTLQALKYPCLIFIGYLLTLIQDAYQWNRPSFFSGMHLYNFIGAIILIILIELKLNWKMLKHA